MISYLAESNGSTTLPSQNLIRTVCQSPSTTPLSSSLVAHDIASPQLPPAIVQSGSNNPATGWIPTAGVTSVTFSTLAPGSSYKYTLVALPRASSNTSQQSTVINQSTTCGFAAPGTGTYAANLCFVDFTPYGGVLGQAPCTSTSQLFTAGITGTPYTLQFCISSSSVLNAGGAAPVPGMQAAAFPTYYDPPQSEAYLGNNGFYTGVPGNPALYQANQSTTSTVSITKIQVLDSQGNAALPTWELVTGDAESTDIGEWMSWTTSGVAPPTLGLIPNSILSPVGNACGSAPPLPLYNPLDLTGLGTTTVKCTASSTQPGEKTGTVMLEALAPTNLTVTMLGTGRQAMFLGVLLP